MKYFYLYVCHNEHTNYVEENETRTECKICASSISKKHGITVRAESEDELSRESTHDNTPESFLSARVAGN